MDMFRKRLQPSADDELFKKLHPVLLDIFCLGMRDAKSKHIVLGSLLMLAYTPISLITSIIFSIVNYVPLMVFWAILSDDINQAGISTPLFIGISILSVNYKDAVTEVTSIIGNAINVFTGGGALKMLCSSYLKGGFFSEMLLANEKMSVPITSFTAVIPKKYGNKYDQLIDLYTTSNQTGEHEELLEIINSHHAGNLFPDGA